MAHYALADKCIDEMREVVKRSAGSKVVSMGEAEASLRKGLVLLLKQSPDDKGIKVKLVRGTTLNFFRHESPTQAQTLRRKQEPRNLDHFFVQVDDLQYTFRTVLKDEDVQGVMVTAIKVPPIKFPAGTSTTSTFRVFSG